ncbi:hypothetical protein Taro_011713, partial [Colocasia esculenta]|nr:hypothetical protein [Colocasia esculenta]
VVFPDLASCSRCRVVLLVGPRPRRGCVPRVGFRIVFDSAGSAGVVFGLTLVVGRGVALFCYFVVLYSSIPAVCLPADVATAEHVATSEDASPWHSVCGEVMVLTTRKSCVATELPVATVIQVATTCISVVCLPADVATAERVATLEEASSWSDATLSRHVVSGAVGLVGLASWAVFSGFRSAGSLGVSSADTRL